MTAGGIMLAGAAALPASPAAATSAIRFVDVNGARLAYRHHGRKGRPPLVFLHGYALRGTGDIYAALIGELTTAFEVFALDMRGHGGSAASVADWSQAVIADDLAAFANALRLDGPVFAGHSLGGFTGLFAQIRHPGLFSSLALMATASAFGGGAPPAVRDAFIRRGRDRAFLRETFGGMFRHPRPGDVEHAVDAVTLIDPKVHDAFYSNFATTRIDDRLGGIDVPVLVLSGAKDTVVPPIDQYRTALGITRAKEVTVPAQGHMLPIEAPTETAREMLAFLGQRA